MQFDDLYNVCPIHQIHRLFLISSSAGSWNAALALSILAFTSASDSPCSSMMLPSKHSRNASNSTRSVDTQIDMKQTKVSLMIDDSRPSKKEKRSPKGPALNKSSRKVGSSVLRLPDGISQETPRSRNRKAQSVSSGKHNLISQVVDNPPESNTRFDATVVASTSTVDEWIQIVRKKSKDIKGNPAPVKVVGKSKADHSDRSAIFHRIKESESSE
ncbi:unnamed protein product, partial [Schistosoma curassoni]|uniref:DUF4005 domain-containing protein n=1 Tax=Schistosoma curassoni TaxID=6186 RepID=A0A183KGE5_9TREM